MAEKKFSELTAKGATIADTDIVAISESAGGGTYTSKSVTGANIKALVTDANMTTTDITTNDVSTSKHGFAPKAPNDTTKFLRGDATWAVVPAGGLTKFTEAEATTSPNNTVYVDSLTAAGSTTNVDVAIVPKGTGALLSAIPDNTTTGGNKRGTNAIDLQTLRSAATQVASGTSGVAIGTRNTSSSSNPYLGGVAIGNNNSSANGSVAIGDGNTSNGVAGVAIGTSCASGTYGAAIGYGALSTGTTFGFAIGRSAQANNESYSFGWSAVSNGQYSVAIGSSATSGGQHSVAIGYSSNSFSVLGRQSRGYGVNVSGDTQKSEFYLSRRTTDATATTLTVGASAASTTNQVILSNNSAYRFKGTIIGKQSGSTNASAWDVDGLIVRGANAAATTLLISNVTLVQNTPAWGTPILSADTAQGCLKVDVIGKAATNIQWTAIIETTEVIYA